MSTTVTNAKIVGPTDAQEGFLGSIGVRFMIDGVEAGERFSLVEHPMSPRALAAPLHLHTREDEYSYVLEGRLGALLGDEVVFGEPGDLVFKPRGQWHTFWNAGDTPARILEIISPAGFEQYFAAMIDLLAGPPPDPASRRDSPRYGLRSIRELPEWSSASAWTRGTDALRRKSLGLELERHVASSANSDG